MKSLAEKISIGIGGFLSLVSMVLLMCFMVKHNFPARYDEAYPAEVLAYVSYNIVPAILLSICFLVRLFSKKVSRKLIRYTLLFCFSFVFQRLVNRVLVCSYRVFKNGDYSFVVSDKQLVVAAVAVVAVVVLFAVNFKKRYSLISGVIVAMIYAVAASCSMTELYEPANELFFCGYACQALALLFVYIAALCSNERKRAEAYVPVFDDIGKGEVQPFDDLSVSTAPIEKSVDREVAVEPQQSEEVKRFCSQCGNKLDGDEKFCQYCGNKVV